MNRAGLAWPNERIERLKVLLADGLSASQIAAELGGGVSRNAVIAKVHRLGLAGSRPVRTKPVREAPPRRRTQRRVAGSAAQPVAVAEPFEPICEPVPETAVTFFDLKEGHCRFPVGDDTGIAMRFCGGQKAAESPYCPYHHAICREASRPRASVTPSYRPAPKEIAR